MMTTSRRKAPSAPAALDFSACIAALEKVGASLLKFQLKLEADRVADKMEPPSAIELERAALLLLAGDPPGEIDPTDPQRLGKVKAARAAISRAIELAREQEFRSWVEQARRNAEDLANDWVAVKREQALSFLRQQQANRRVAALARKIKGKARSMVLPAEFPENPQILCGLGNANSAATAEFLRAVIKAGFVTAAEIARLEADKGEPR